MITGNTIVRDDRIDVKQELAHLLIYRSTVARRLPELN